MSCDQKLCSAKSDKEKKGKVLSVLSSPVPPPPQQRHNASVSAKPKFLCQLAELPEVESAQYKYYLRYLPVPTTAILKCVIRCGQTGKENTAKWDDGSSSTSQRVGSWIRTQIYWPLVRCLCFGSFWRVLGIPGNSETPGKSSSSPSVVQVRYKGCRCSQMEGCASVPHNGTCSNFNTTVQPFASFNCRTQSGVCMFAFTERLSDSLSSFSL